MGFRYITYIALWALLFIRCNPQPEAPLLLREAQRLAETKPDSAMLLIDAISYPQQSFNRQQYMEYLITRTQVYHKNYRDISGDTIIFTARDYFLKRSKAEDKMPALACYYSGWVYREQNDYDHAMHWYKEAETRAQAAKDTCLTGLIHYNIGDLFHEAGNYAEAAESYKQAWQLYILASEKYEAQVKSLAGVGTMYLLANQSDSAFYYLEQGAQVADTSGDRELQSLSAQHLSIAYSENKQYDKAETYLRKSYQLNTDKAEIPRYYLNFAELYTDMGKQDSVILYTDKLKQCIDDITDDNLKVSIYGFLGGEEKRKGNFGAAFDYQGKYTLLVEQITNKQLQQSVYETQRKYNYERMQNREQRRVTVFQFWSIMLLLAIIVGGVIFTWYTWRQKNKLLKTQKNVGILRTVSKNLNETHENVLATKEKDFAELLHWKLDIIKKTALLTNGDINKKTQEELAVTFRRIVFGRKEGYWQSFLSIFNQLHPRVSQWIKQNYPNLTENEYKTALLTYIGMTTQDIAVILQASQHTVQAYRTALRKKIGISLSSVDTATYLWDKTKNV